MKKRKEIGCLFAFVALVASGISFSGVSSKKIDANAIPIEEQYCVLADAHVPYSYSSSPTGEPKYANTSRFSSHNINYDLSQSGIMYDRMNVASTWSSYRGESVKVAVIDTGCYTTHEDFSGTTISNLSGTFSSTGTFSSSNYSDNNSQSHGTASAATIAAAVNNKGGTGIAPNVELVILKCESFTAAAIRNALAYCVTNNIDVVNMSIQGYASGFSYSYTEDFGEYDISGDAVASFTKSTLQTQIDNCYNAGITVVAAAGNYNSTQISYPAGNDHVISVASTGLTEANKSNKAGYSNYGSWIDVCAPGYVISPSKTSTSSYQLIMGTSFSAPLVTGAIALYKSKYPSATPDQIEKALKFTANKLSWNGSGAGAVDVGKFLAQDPEYKYVESVTLSENTKTLKVGDTYQLNPTISPSNAANKNVIYESSDPDICSVDSNGVLTAHSVGQDVYIYATSEENSNAYDGILVNVEPASDTPQDADVALSSGTYSGSDASAYITWNVSNVLTIKQEKGTGNNVANYVSAPRWYQNNIIRFTPESNVTITSITFTLDSSYKNGLTGEIWSNGLYSLSSNTGTWTGETSDEFTVVLKSQTRPTAISVRYTKGSGGGSGGGETNYTVTFNANGGTGTMANQTTTGSTYTTTSCSFTYSGYKFNKWALDSISGAQYGANETITGISANITLYAIWVEISSGDDDYSDYYPSSIESLSGNSLLSSLRTLNLSKRTNSIDYDSQNNYYKYTDYDPEYVQYDNNNQPYSTHLLSFYSGISTTSYNKEHVWPNSRGGGSKNGLSGSPYVEDDIFMPRPTINSENSDRGNSAFVEGMNHQSNGWDPVTAFANTIGVYTSIRGECARIIFYCMTVNANLRLVDDANTDFAGVGGRVTMGKLSDLLKWNLQNPVNDREIRRQSGGQYLQGNRNSFVDHPEYACKIWGDTNDTTRSICGLSGKTLSSLTYTGTPNKTSYEAGESFASTGITVTATYSDGSTENVTSSVSWTPTSLTEGTTSVTGTYTYGSISKTITVSGLTVTASSGGGDSSVTQITNISTLSNGDKVYIATGLNSTDNGLTGWNNNNDATISTTQSSWKQYTVEISGTTVYLKDGSDYIAAVSSNGFKYGSSGGAITLDDSGHVKVGNRFICINGSNIRCYTSIGTYTPFYLYKITSSTPTPTLSSITLNTDNVTKTFIVGDTFNSTGLVVTANYSDSTSATVTSGYTVSTPDMSTSGTKTVTVTYSGKSATYQITVNQSGTITYQLEPDSSEVPFNSGTNQTASVGVKVYQYNNGVKGSAVSSGSVNVDTSSLGRKIIQYTYNNVQYNSTVKVTNHGSTEPTGLNLSADFSSGKSNVSDPWSCSGCGSDYTSHSPYLLRFDNNGDSLTAAVNTSATSITVGITVKMIGGNTGSSFTVSAKKANGDTVASTTLSFSGAQNSTHSPTGTINNSQGATITSIVFSFNKGANVGLGSATITAVGESGFDLKQAKAWATYFVTQTRTNEACLAEQDSQKLVGLKAVWADLAYEYTEMIGESKDEFCESSDATIIEARTHYLYIISKFGAENLGTDGAFVKDSHDNVLNAKQNNPISILAENPSTALIVILSLVSVSAIGLYFYARKRKED